MLASSFIVSQTARSLQLYKVKKQFVVKLRENIKYFVLFVTLAIIDIIVFLIVTAVVVVALDQLI